jgi:1,4-dihydroxy-2-naphthoate polyprenyltransferase
MNKTNIWIAGARPRTLPAAISPVLVGTALIRRDHHSINYLNALLALFVSLLLQIAVNYSNDYSDGIRGTDNNRVGPVRLVASGLASARAVKQAAFICFAIASALGTILAIRVSWWLVLVGLVSIFAAWNYTGGKRPYGYSGLGEISVFIFFGLVATVGSYVVQSHRISWQSVLISVPVGALSCSLLAINNLRDLPKDSLVGKKTVAVRLGDKRARAMFNALLLLAHLAGLLAAFITPWALITLLFVPISLKISRGIRAGATGAQLIPMLGQVGKLQLFLSTSLAIALLL